MKAKTRDITELLVEGITAQRVAAELRASPFVDFRSSDSDESGVLFTSTHSAGTLIGRARLYSITLKIRQLSTGVLVSPLVAFAQKNRRAGLLALAIFVLLGILTAIIGLAAMPPMLVGTMLSVVGFWWVSHDLLSWESDVTEAVTKAVQKLAENLGGFANPVITGSGSGLWIGVLGVGLAGWWACWPILITGDSSILALLVVPVTAVWLFLVAHGLATSRLRLAIAASLPRILAAAWPASILLMPLIDHGSLPCGCGVVMGGLLGVVTVKLLGRSVRATFSRTRAARLAFIQAGNEAWLPSLRAWAARCAYAASVLILSVCLWGGLLVSASALLRATAMGLTVLPVLVLFGWMQSGAFRSPPSETPDYRHIVEPMLRQVEQFFRQRGLLGTAEIAVIGSSPRWGIVGTALLCVSAFGNRWVIVVPPYFAAMPVIYGEALLAHELGHIVAQGRRQRFWRAVGVVSLVGVGTLLPLMGRDGEDDAADAYAREYLAWRGLSDAVLGRALLCAAWNRNKPEMQPLIKAVVSDNRLTAIFMLTAHFPLGTASVIPRKRGSQAHGTEGPFPSAVATAPPSDLLREKQERDVSDGCSGTNTGGGADRTGMLWFDLRFSPWDWVNYFIKPRISLNGEENPVAWGCTCLCVPSGKHTIRVIAGAGGKTMTTYVEVHVLPDEEMSLTFTKARKQGQSCGVVQEQGGLAGCVPSAFRARAIQQSLVPSFVLSLLALVVSVVFRLPDAAVSALWLVAACGIFGCLWRVDVRRMIRQYEAALRRREQWKRTVQEHTVA